MKEEGKGYSNQIKSNKERGTKPQGGASRVPDSPTVYHREKKKKKKNIKLNLGGDVVIVCGCYHVLIKKKWDIPRSSH